jgi:dTDP-4-dehydrorhamnose 3,5-epimerase
MKFRTTRFAGLYVIEPELLMDERGSFARTWCKREFTERGLSPDLAQCNISFNKRRGTLRGMHHQIFPHEEAKLVRCTAGGVYDVVIDLRPESETYKQWFAVELTAENRKMIYIPEGFSHGFMTLQDNTEVFYQMSTFYAPACARGVRYNDPAFAVQWPMEVAVISDKDMQYPDFVEKESPMEGAS